MFCILWWETCFWTITTEKTFSAVNSHKHLHPYTRTLIIKYFCSCKHVLPSVFPRQNTEYSHFNNIKNKSVKQKRCFVNPKQTSKKWGTINNQHLGIKLRTQLLILIQYSNNKTTVFHYFQFSFRLFITFINVFLETLVQMYQ